MLTNKDFHDIFRAAMLKLNINVDMYIRYKTLINRWRLNVLVLKSKWSKMHEESISLDKNEVG